MEKKLQQMYIVMGALCLILVCSSLAMAAGNQLLPNGGLSGEDILTAPVPWPVAKTSAKVAAYISPDGVVIRAKGVADVTHPLVGIYCIKPSMKLDLTKVVPIVSVEWGYSSGDALLAFYFDYTQFASGDCPEGYLEVLTFNFGGGAPVPSDTVAFTIHVH